MKHEAASTRLNDYLDGTLSLREAARVEAHLIGCEACRHQLGQLRRTVELLRGLRGVVEAPDLTGPVLERIRRGEAEPSLLERVRSVLLGFLGTPLGAPLATACVGLLLLGVLPRIEVEVTVPGSREAAPRIARSAEPRARAAGAPLAALRVNESRPSEPRLLPRPTAGECLESSPHGACLEHHALMTKLAMENPWAFMAELEEVPEPRRDDLLLDLSRFAAESGEAPVVAAQLRATGDPQAQRIARGFEQAR